MKRSENNYLSSVGNESLRFDDYQPQCGIDKAHDLRAQFWAGHLRKTIRSLTSWIGNGIRDEQRAVAKQPAQLRNSIYFDSTA
ncbi:MAG: hypothetical protein V2J55_00835 [Candidatus Competibacteraceae bacterium]|nr:hypothetical protein [Candidatus Competibacteraceae bacterium]